ncbi:MAG: phosphatase [Clostridium perfringens]|nr:phosphatase [Clostridium perfringens]
MKKLFKYLSIFIIILSIFSLTQTNFTFAKTINNNETLKILDTDSKNDLPNQYRNLKDLNISGSAQFTPKQVEYIINDINTKDILFIDLRQESHGFINNLAFSYLGDSKTLNYELGSTDVLKNENILLSSIPLNNNITIYRKSGNIYTTINAETVCNEENLIINSNAKYLRLPIKDESVPSLDIVDNFVSLINNKPNNLHIHFHCTHGKGRTTQFIVLYQIMNNSHHLSLKQILKYQINKGGVDLTKLKERDKFLKNFYKYVEENKATNYEIPYSKWCK